MIFYDLGDMKSGQAVGSTSTAFQDYDYNQHSSDGERFFQNHKRGCRLNSVDDTKAGDEAGDYSASPTLPLSDVKKQKKSDGNDGSSIEVVRRPRGRPLGSKNKPKPPVVITSESIDSYDVMRPHVLEISSGHDIGDALAGFSRRRNVGVSVLAGNGIVSNITLRQPQTTPSSSYSIPSAANSSTFTFQGRFEILSISATFFPPTAMSALPTGTGGMLSVSLAGPHGQIVGGAVAGPLVTAGTVTVIAATFQNPSFHKLPMEDTEISGDEGVGNGGEVLLLQHQATHHQQQQQQQRYSGTGLAVGGEPSSTSSGLPMSASCHLLSDIIWAPMVRPQHPPPY